MGRTHIGSNPCFIRDTLNPTMTITISVYHGWRFPLLMKYNNEIFGLGVDHCVSWLHHMTQNGDSHLCDYFLINTFISIVKLEIYRIHFMLLLDLNLLLLAVAIVKIQSHYHSKCFSCLFSFTSLEQGKHVYVFHYYSQ